MKKAPPISTSIANADRRSRRIRGKLSAQRRGTSLMELAVATFLLSGLLMPTLATLTEANQFQKKRADQEELIFHAENALAHTQRILVDPSTFLTASTSGLNRQINYASNRIPNLRCETAVSPDPSGISSLVRADVTAWEDDNRNGSLDAGEISTTLTTWVPRR